MANVLGVSQAQVSRIENQADLYLSTLRTYIQAMGGELQLRAIFPDGQATAITVDELLEPADTEPPRSGRAPEDDIHTAFAFVHLDVGRYDAAEEKFHAASSQGGSTTVTDIDLRSAVYLAGRLLATLYGVSISEVEP